MSHREQHAAGPAGRFRWLAVQGGGQRVGCAGRASSRLDWPRTLRAKRTAPLSPSHLCFRYRLGESAALHCFVLDCSGSMLSGRRLALAKGLLAVLFDRAYQERAEIALVCFGGAGAEVRRPPSAAQRWDERWLAPIGAGGGTPLTQGVTTAQALLGRAARRRPAQPRWLWLLTDGRSNEAPSRPTGADQVVVVDFDNGGVRLARCVTLAHDWRAQYCEAASLLEAAGAPTGERA